MAIATNADSETTTGRHMLNRGEWVALQDPRKEHDGRRRKPDEGKRQLGWSPNGKGVTKVTVQSTRSRCQRGPDTERTPKMPSALVRLGPQSNPLATCVGPLCPRTASDG